MGLQQASLDFFNTPPENDNTAANKPVSNKEGSTRNHTKPAPDEIAEPASETPGVAETVAEPLPEPEFPVISVENASSMEDPALTTNDLTMQVESLVVDDEVRVMDFVVKEKKQPTVITGKKSTRGRMKLSEMDVLVDLVDVPADDVLFQKRYYNIGAVSDMFKVNISLIRFWENEFDILKPKKNGKGDRLFRPEDIKNLQLIYHLLREKKYTIDGAKDFLKKNKKAEDSFAVIDSLKKIKSFLLELKSNL